MKSNNLFNNLKFNNSSYIIAEIGNNHNGNIEKAEKLVRSAANSGADAVKFQTWKAEDIHNPLIKANAYKNFDASNEYEYWIDYVKTLELDYRHYKYLQKISKECGVDFISTPASFEALEILTELKVPIIKIASMDITNEPFLKECAKTGIPIILSSGMSTIEEIDNALEDLKGAEVSILHCVSNYPTKDQDVNLSNITMLKNRYKNNIVGFSSHTKSFELEIAARSLGAVIFEKHFTLNKKDPLLAEHHISLEPDEFSLMVNGIRRVEKAMGKYDRELGSDEKDNAKNSRRSVVAIRNIQKGEVIKESYLKLLRPGNGIMPRDINKIYGKRAKNSINAYNQLKWEDVE